MQSDIRKNESGQSIGFALPHWTARPQPPATPVEGSFCRIERLDPAVHCEALFEANLLNVDHSNWTYLPYGPFDTLQDYRQWLDSVCESSDPFFHAIIDKSTELATGVASLMRIDTNAGVIETGHINYSPKLQQTPAATEAMYLLMRRVFDELGYRRYEWKCDSLNGPSRAAAQRLGFQFEGIFRQNTVYKNRNRDTAWFSIIDSEWPTLKAGFEGWLDASNFDENGRQRKPLAAFR